METNQTNQEKGINYEIQIRDYIINDKNKLAYLWHHTPEDILIKNGIIGSHNIHRLNRIAKMNDRCNPLNDTGVDIIQCDDNCCSLVQCKNGYKKGLTMKDLAGFMCWVSSLPNLYSYIYYTNKLSTNIRELPVNDHINYIKQAYIINDKNIVIDKIVPFDYQVEATQQFINFNRGILSMPCGTGKTMTSYLISNSYKQIIIISPLKQFAKQNLDKYIEYGFLGNTLLVDSDGERDLKQIKKFIKSNKSFLISSTFCSVDVILKSLKYMNDPLFIIDEFHNLSKNNVTNDDDDFYKLLNSNQRILFMSATPRVYEMEEEDYNDSIFGPIIYNMTFTEAIQKKYITDYQIWLPSISENNDELINDLTIYSIDHVIKAKCIFFFSCLVNNGSRKCIIYCIDNNELENMKESMNKLNEYYCLNYLISQITSSNNAKSRKDILDNFKSDDRIQLLFSIRILDECIDIPTCDSIFITYPSQSKIRTIQRLSRCIRINKRNKFKKGNIYIWCDQYDQILNTLSGLKEYDIFFKDKIKINEIAHYRKSINELIIMDNQLITNYLVGIKEFKQLTWNDKLTELKTFIDLNKRRPSDKEKETEKVLGGWLGTQLSNRKAKKQIMLDEDIRSLWDSFIKNYKQYFISNEELWINKLTELKAFIGFNKQRPSQVSKKETEKGLSLWLANQLTNRKAKKEIMLNEDIKGLWNSFIKDYQQYIMSNEELWTNNLDELKTFIDLNKRRPNRGKETEKVLGSWLANQLTNRKKEKKIMSNEDVKKLWDSFIKDYQQYFN